MPEESTADLIPTGSTKVRYSTRLFSEEVGIAEAGELKPVNDPGYVFSGNRRFEDGKGLYE